MRIAFLTNEYPPNVYGGAGVHVDYLSRELAAAPGDHHVDVFSFGEQDVSTGRLTVKGMHPGCDIPAHDPRHGRLLDALLRDLMMAGAVQSPDIIHCHTWYSHLGGILAKQLTGGRLVLTTHSLEPHRPWKAEQLGTAYRATTWVEGTAYRNADGVVAVSAAMKRDVQALYGVDGDRIRVIHNGIDPDEYRPTPGREVLRRYRIDPDLPMVLFVGRITRQKGILHLVRALPKLRGNLQVVLCAGAPDTPEIGREMTDLVAEAQRECPMPIHWISAMVDREDIIRLYSEAELFVCPSVYEPFGIINLEAMACETPVVASAVGGIPEIIIPGETGVLVPFDAEGSGSAEPKDPEAFTSALAQAISELMEDADRRHRMGRAARKRVLDHFSWRAIARQTIEFYGELVRKPPLAPEWER